MTDFEKGFPIQTARSTDGEWEPDPWICGLRPDPPYLTVRGEDGSSGLYGWDDEIS